MSRSRSSWHSMSRSPWDSMALQRRSPTSCSPVHVLTHVFSSARFFTCCAWLRVVWFYPTPLAPLPSARCACRGRCLQSSDVWFAGLTSTTRGQRALLDADMLELIDRSACLVELVTVESCAPSVLVLYPQQARPAPRPVAAREFSLREALWKVFCSLGCSLRAAPVASLRLLSLTGKSWMIWSFHCFVMWSTSCAS